MDSDGFGFGWIRMDSDGFGWIRMRMRMDSDADADGFGCGWIRMDSDGCGWIRMDSDTDADGFGCGWMRMDSNAYAFGWIRMMLMDADGCGCGWIDSNSGMPPITLVLFPCDENARTNVATRFLVEPSGYRPSDLTYDASPKAYYNWLNRPEVIFPEYQYRCYPDIGYNTPVCIRPGKLHFGPGLSASTVQPDLDHYRRMAAGRLKLLRAVDPVYRAIERGR
jgi:hypothetical protein